MGAAFGDEAVVHDDDLVGFADSGEPVGNNYGCAAGNKCIYGVLNELLAFAVDRRSSLVENEDRWVVKQRAGEGKQLALALG